MLTHPAPRWFTIPAHRPFVDDLATGLVAAVGSEPEALADCTVLTPTRRGARALTEAFVRTGGGKAVLLPQILALGDLDEGEPPFEPGDLALDLPPAISPMRRRFELARLVLARADLFDRRLDAAGALELADALGGLLDSLQIEEVEDAARIDSLVEGDLARHWRRSAEFLKTATDAWPRRLAELGLVDVVQRRTALLRALADQWARDRPQKPLIAAGSTGSAPATADLLRVIAEAPQGAVVLPGLDLDLADAAWDAIGEGHPQRTLQLLLRRAGVARTEVLPWPAQETTADAVRGRSRRRLVNEALRPAEATADWLQVIETFRAEGVTAGVDPVLEGMEGLSTLTARTEDDAAAVAALLMREALETPDKTCALVTPDPALARRVSAKLSRWGLGVDSSAGTPLAQTAPGVLLTLVAGALADPLDPVRLLAMLKHPLVALGREPEALAEARRTLELKALRGARVWSVEELEVRLAEAPDALALLRHLTATLIHAEPGLGGQEIAEAARHLAQALEALAAQPGGGTGKLWAGAAGEAAAALLSSLLDEAEGLPPVSATAFAALLERLIAGQVVRTGGAAHPRLRILGAIEARLVRADRLVLAGLEEGVWPRPAETDPFLSRPMRAQLGLPPPERRVGLSAHDFAQAACAPEVILINVERRGDQPAVKSRWLWRLETLLRGAGAALPAREDALLWARGLDAAPADAPPSLAPASSPDPRPPLSARPRKLSVTQVETWVRDPYAVYARHVLGLRPLPPPDERVEVRIRGTAIHSAFEDLAARWDAITPGAESAEFARLYLDALRAAGATEGGLAREGALAVRAGHWVAAFERRRRDAGVEVVVEKKGTLTLPELGFTLTARTDRLELTRDGAAHVLDFKTGRAPSDKEIRTGFSPQLTLTAAILMQGEFESVGRRAPGELVYVRVTGREPAGEEIVRVDAIDSAARAQEALTGLGALVVRYDSEDQPYRSRTAPRFVKTYASDYDHLARFREWSTGDEEEEG